MARSFKTQTVLAAVLATLLLAGPVAGGDRYVEEAGYQEDDGVVEHKDKKTRFLFHKDAWQAKDPNAKGFAYGFVPHYTRPMAYHYRPAYHFSSNYGLQAYGWYQGRGGYNYGLPYGYSPAHDRLDYQQYNMGVENKTTSALQPPPQGFPYCATFLRSDCESACCCCKIPMAGYPSYKYYSYSQTADPNCPPGFAGAW